MLGVNSTNRFKQVYKNYEEYKVTGMSVKWFPTNIKGVVDPGDNDRVGGAIQTVLSFDDVDTYDTAGYNLQKVTALETFKMYDTNRPVSIYRNNRPLAAAKNYKWRDTNESWTNPNDIPKSSINLRILTQGFGQSSVPGSAVTIGYLKYTYYVTFKGQSYQ